MSPFERLRGVHLTGHPLIEDIVFTILSLLVMAVAISAITAPQEAQIAVAAAPAGAGG